MNRKSFRRFLRFISIAPGLYGALAFLLARRVTVQGRSMAPELLPGERLLVDRLVYARDRPRVGDIVLVAHPMRPELRMVKRIALLQGARFGDDVVGRGEYWVEGDNADESTDSREFGPVSRRDLLGRAWLRYWPAERWRTFR